MNLAIWDGYIFDTNTYARLCSTSAARDLEWIVVCNGSEISGVPKDWELSVLGPPLDIAGWSANDASLVLMLEIRFADNQRLRLLTTGDIETDGEAALLEHEDLYSQLLKLPHHGSPTSSSPEFIAAVQPDITVATRAGRWASSRHKMSYEAIERLRSGGFPVYITGDDGALLFEPALENGEAKWRLVDWRNPSFGRWLLGQI